MVDVWAVTITTIPFSAVSLYPVPPYHSLILLHSFYIMLGVMLLHVTQ